MPRAPGMWWLRPAAAIVRRVRWKLGPSSPSRRVEAFGSEVVSGSLEWVRAMRDAVSEAVFFLVWGNAYSMFLADRAPAEAAAPAAKDPLTLPVVKEALAAIDRGGRAEAIARVCALLSEDDVRVPLALVEL